MRFTQATYKQNKQLNLLIEKIAKETGVEQPVVFYFIINDLERIYEEKLDTHLSKFKRLENEFNELTIKEKSILQDIENKNTIIEETKKKISEAIKKIEIARNNVDSLTANLVLLNDDFNKLVQNQNKLEKEKKETEYKIMLKRHSINNKTDIKMKRLGLILTIFTIIGVIIAIILIFTK